MPIMRHAGRVLQPPRRLLVLRGRRLTRRLLQLYAGLALYGASMALIIRSTLGNMPWDVLHQGLAGRIGWSIGAVSILVGALVLLAWIPLRQRPGLGTIANALVVGLAIDLTLLVLPDRAPLAVRWVELFGGIALVAVGSAFYLGAALGPGPRDGLMAGLHRVTGRPVALVRGCIEVSALLAGALLGGTFGVGTVAFALLIGPAVAVALRAGRTEPGSI